MKKLEQYIKKASQGTFGRTRASIQEELRANIGIRIEELLLHGMNSEQALEQALTELGAPTAISSEMTRMYTMPNLFKAALPMVAITYFSFSMLSSSLAKIEYTAIGPIQTCPTQITSPDLCMQIPHGKAWLEMNSFMAELQKQGVKVEQTGQKMYVMDYVPATANTSAITKKVLLAAPELKLTFPNQKPIVMNEISRGFNALVIGRFSGSRQSFQYTMKSMREVTFQNISFERDGKTYLAPENFIATLREKTKLPIRLKGWENPKLIVGTTTISLGSSQTPVVLSNIFRDTLTFVLGNSYAKGLGLPVLISDGYQSERQGKTVRHRVHINAVNNSVYGIIHSTKNGLIVDLAPVKNGVLEFSSPHKTLSFSKNIKALGNSNGKKAIVALVEMTGLLSSNTDAFKTRLPRERRSLSLR
jgi:hypothetical protein